MDPLDIPPPATSAPSAPPAGLSPSSFPPSPRKPPSRGFSLIEVTIALGIVAFAVVAILGLLPTGLNTLRHSMDETIQAQILQTISGRAVIADFENLQAPQTWYFDDEGIPVSGAAESYFTVTTESENPTFPGSTSAPDINSHLMSLRVEISRTGRTNDQPVIRSIKIARNTQLSSAP